MPSPKGTHKDTMAVKQAEYDDQHNNKVKREGGGKVWEGVLNSIEWG